MRSAPSRFLPALAGMGLVLFDNAFTPVNTDLGWMLAFARDSLARGGLLRQNFWSFTEPDRPQTMIEWGSSFLLYALQKSFGAGGLIAAKWVLAAICVALLAWAVSRVAESALVRTVVALVATHAMWICFELVRSQLFTFALLAALIGLTLGHGPRVRRDFWLASLLFIPWANLHGGFSAGLVLFGGLCAARWFEQRLGWREVEVPQRELLALPLVALALTLLNPYGPQLLSFTAHHISDPSRFWAREWLPLWHWSELARWERFSAYALGAATLTSLALLPRRRLDLWLLLAFAVATGISASRHLRMAPLLLAPVLAAALQTLTDRLPESRRPRLDRLALAAAGLAAAVFFGLWLSRAQAALRFIDYRVPNPTNAIAVMRANRLFGRVWNDYDWGGMLIWAVPESKVACDGRHGIAYSVEVIEASIQLGVEDVDPLPLLDRYGADMVLLPPQNPATKRLAKTFAPLYCDAEACLLSRNPEHLARVKKELLQPSRPLQTSDLFDAPGGFAAEL